MGGAATPEESLLHSLPSWPASPGPARPRPGASEGVKARQAPWQGVHVCGCSQLRVAPTARVGMVRPDVMGSVGVVCAPERR
eukprot:scaffold7339_cov124-Isochrysis_galbana.AAC.3